MSITLVSSTFLSANNGGGVTLTFSPAGITNDYIVVSAIWGSTAGTPTCTTSSAGAYTTLVNTFAGGGNSRLTVFGTRVSTANNLATQAIVSGSARTSDSTIAIGQIFRGVSTATTPTDAAPTTTTGAAGGAPDSPACTGVNTNDAVLTCVSLAANTAPVPPAGYTGIGDNQTDTNPSGGGQAWRLVYSSTGANNPPAWTGTTAAWGAATVLLTEAPSSAFALSWGAGPDEVGLPDLTRPDVVGY